MTKSPLTATLIPLIPLAALGWPLAKVLNQKAYQPVEIEDMPTGPLTTADLEINTAHPFKEMTVTIGESSWSFAPDEDVKEIHYERGSRVTLLVSVIWPEDTPKTALRLELLPEEIETRSYTLWGLGEATEEITFTWDDQP
ncbi:MAG: hypothetical protein ACJAT6_001601 [Akkermansiaceae bacterium]|jgi:hypothetical protein